VVEHHKALDLYAQEGSDPAWAPATEKTILADLKTAASAGGFDVRTVNCRTTMCVADIQFPTYGNARTGWSRLMGAPNQSRCAFEIVLDPAPSDTGTPFSTQMLYNCEKIRSGEY